MPSDLTSAADYSRGTAWFRLEARGKPTLTALRIQPCLDETLAQGGRRSCAPAQILSDTGVYTWSAPLSQWSPALVCRGPDAGFTLRSAGGNGVEIRFAPARALVAEARCWHARGKSLAWAAWRPVPETPSILLPLAPGTRSGPVWVELRAGGRRWVSVRTA